MQKRVLAVHDISCFGRCSLTVALPLISSCGVECTCLPTSVLSTHTGGFTGYTFRDLTEDIKPIVEHWKSLNLQFDAFYTGYLGSFDQIQIVSDAIDLLRNENSLVYIDPVMADNGKLYAGFLEEFPEHMKKLCSKADVIIPNITEACLMVDYPYREGPYDREYIEGLIEKLNREIGVRRIILTGVSFDNETLGACSYDDGQFDYYFTRRIDGYFHGTGDVFGSCALVALMKGLSLKEASKIACDFTVGCIERTLRDKTDIRFGVNFEEGLTELGLKLK